MNCVYLLGETPIRKTEKGNDVFRCAIHGECVKRRRDALACCRRCKDNLIIDDESFSQKYQDPLKILGRDSQPTHCLRGLLAGGVSFLVCGGPSAKQLDLTLLNRRGIWSLAVNNMAAHANVNAFICADPPSKFHNGIWQDPRIMKFIPLPKMKRKRGKLRQKINNDFEPLSIDGKEWSAIDSPNVWGYGRRAWFIPDESFFMEEEAPWGNHNAGVLRTGEKKTVCTMLCAIRLLYYLGSRTIYLIGVDFGMKHTRGLLENYAFEEERDRDAIESNNAQYQIVNDWLCTMNQNGVFQRFGLSIWNCNRFSNLRAFPFVPFEDAVDHALKYFPKEPFDTRKWYEK